jgi:predicted metalloprotease with PDZ domain
VWKLIDTQGKYLLKKHLPYLFFESLSFIFLLFAANSIFAGIETDPYEIIQKQIKSGEYDLIISIEPTYDYSKKNKISLSVEVTFKGDESGKTIILLPDKFGTQPIENCIRKLSVRSGSCYMENNGISNQKVINHPPHAVVTVSYEIYDVRVFSAIDISSRYQPIITENYFHIFGETFFILPLNNWDKENNIKMLWRNLPKNWSLVNSFGSYRSDQTIRKNLWDFRQAIYMGGSDLRIITKYVSGYPFYVAIRGTFAFSDSYIADFIWSVINETRSFWNDTKYYNYLVTVIGVDGRHAYLSEGRVNSFSLFIGPRKDLDYDIKKMIAREAFQNWLGRIIQPEEPKQIVSWFFSGFGEYYARLLLLRANKITLEEYVNEYNAVLDQYAKSPSRYESSTQLNSVYVNDPDFSLLQYFKGDIIAHNLNTAIFNYSSGGKNLDDFMHDLYNRTKKEDLQISNGVLSALIRFYAGENTLSEIMSSVNSGKPLKPRPDALGRCSVLKVDYTRKFFLLGEQYEVYSYMFNKDLFSQNRDEFLKWFNQRGE